MKTDRDRAWGDFHSDAVCVSLYRGGGTLGKWARRERAGVDRSGDGIRPGKQNSASLEEVGNNMDRETAGVIVPCFLKWNQQAGPEWRKHMLLELGRAFSSS